MKLLFLGTLFDKRNEEFYLNNSKSKLQNAANSYQWNLINGFDTLLKPNEFTIYNTIPVGTYPKHYNKFLIKSKEWSHRNGAFDYEIGFINFQFIKQIMRYFRFKKKIINWIIEQKQDCVVVLYSTYLPLLYLLKQMKKSFPNISIVVIVTDIDGEFGVLPKNPLKSYFMKFIGKYINSNIHSFDYFVLLTEEMKIPLRLESRKFVVVEGVCPSIENPNRVFENTLNKKIILYTGSLDEIYGIKSLLLAFNFIKNANYELWICGSGGIEDQIKKAVEKDSRIIFYGYVLKQNIIELQKKATLLVNPRINNGSYTKYSFPSKTMDYMNSGVPVLMFKLDGLGVDYHPYLYFFDSSEPELLAARIVEICEKNKEDLVNFGQKAKEFIRNNKNSVIQARKILEMINA